MDALFELGDALSSEAEARSLPELPLSPFFRRTWASVYETLEDGLIDERCWMTVWTTTLLAEHTGPVWISIDSTAIARPEAETSPDRGINLRAEYASCHQAGERGLAVLDGDASA